MHIGQGESVSAAEIVALIDLQQPLSQDTEALLAGLKASGRVRTLHTPAKTLVVCRGPRAYLTGTGLRTLRERFERGPLQMRSDNEDLSEVNHG